MLIIAPTITVQNRLLSVLKQRVIQLQKLNDDKHRKKILGRKQNEIEEEFKKFSTRELLAFLQFHRFEPSSYCLPITGNHPYSAGEFDSKTLINLERWALKKILATRPHVPNKMEAKRNRKAMATMHHGSKKHKRKMK